MDRNQKRLYLIGLFTVAQQLGRQQEEIVKAAADVAGEQLDSFGYGLANDYTYGFTGMDPTTAADKYLDALEEHPEYTKAAKDG